MTRIISYGTDVLTRLSVGSKDMFQVENKRRALHGTVPSVYS